MSENYTVPVLIEDMAKSLLNPNEPAWKKQHYEQTLREIIGYSEKALKVYEQQAKHERIFGSKRERR